MNSDSSRAAAHGEGGGGAGHLVKMANDIGDFFFARRPEREDAIAGIANHITKFWTSDCARNSTSSEARCDAALDELPREAVAALAVHQVAAQKEPPRRRCGLIGPA